MMHRTRPSALAALLLAALALAWAAPAAALPPALEKAKAEGLVGEQADGYLGLVSGSAPPDVRKGVDEVNAQRRALYEQRGREQGTDARTYGAVVGAKLVAEERPGNYVRTDRGWVKK